MNSLRSQLGMNPPPRIIIGSRVEDALGGEGELDGLCKICQGRPFILAVRVRSMDAIVSSCGGETFALVMFDMR